MAVGAVAATAGAALLPEVAVLEGVSLEGHQGPQLKVQGRRQPQPLLRAPT